MDEQEQPRWLVRATGRLAAAAALSSLAGRAEDGRGTILRAAPAAQNRTHRLQSIGGSRLVVGRSRLPLVARARGTTPTIPAVAERARAMAAAER